MNTPTPPGDARPNPALNARALLKNLQESFSVFGNCSPLAIGIDKQVLARRPDIDRKALRIALGMHTNSLRYLKIMEKATHRLDLDGNVGDEVSAEHRSHATQVLRERFKKDAERRQAQRAAEAAEARERERAQKLSQLVEKFAKDK
jgi:ProP effector